MRRLYEIMSLLKLDALLLTDGYNIHYISGYRGHTGCMLITANNRCILTDSRYTEQVSIEAPDFECVDVGMDGYTKTIVTLLNKYGISKNSKDAKVRIGFENEDISYRQFKSFSDKFESLWEPVQLDGKIDNLRSIKTDREISLIAKAESIGDQAFNYILTFIEEGMSEKDVALELEYKMRKLGASGLSFDTIVASGPNSSLPHAVPTDRKLCGGDFVTMDFGCIYDGYCSDMTRTVLIGDKPTSKQAEIYNIVLEAQNESMKLIKPGTKCSDVDKRARDIISNAGYGENFGHGLGHSVGLYIHEEPRLSRKCESILKPGMLVTVEPGIYLTGEFGVRIEDLVVVTEDGYRNLTASPKAIIML